MVPSEPTKPPYQQGMRYTQIPASFTRLYATITDHGQRGTRYCFALPHDWQGYYEVPTGRTSRFVEALPAADPSILLYITFTAVRVFPATAEISLGHPVYIPNTNHAIE